MERSRRHGLVPVVVRAVVALVAAVGAVAGVAGGAGAASPAPTRTVLSTADIVTVGGQVVHLKAVVKPVLGAGLPTGKVTFRNGTTAIGSANLVLANGVQTAKLSIGTLAVGTHSLNAVYAGSAAWATSTSLSIAVRVDKDGSTTTVTPAKIAGTPGKYNLNVKVRSVKPGLGTPTGYVTFVIDGGPGQAVALDSTARAHLAIKFTVGTKHTVKVSYVGDGLRKPSSGSVSFTA